MFDWQTEEDNTVWEEEKQQPIETAVSPKHHWWRFVMVVSLLLFAGLFIYRQLQQQTETAVANVEADILSTHQLVRTAAETGDVDLLRILLSGRNLKWVDAQEQLVAHTLLFNRAPLFLNGQADNQTIVTTNISPTLDSAELVFDQEYVTTRPDGEIETVTLRQTAVYRQGRTRWLLSPPDEAFWGEWEIMESDRFILIFPSRDAEIARQLFVDLSVLLSTACNELADLNCAQAQQISLRLGKDPQSLADLADVANLYRQELRLELPTPSLVGLPVDDAGYEALYRGYGALLVTAVIADATEWECCDAAPIFAAFTEYQLGQLSLRPWPVTLDDHFTLWAGEEIVTFDSLFEIWNQDGFAQLAQEDRLFLYTAVDFLIRQFPNRSPAFMQQQMSIPGMSYYRWLNRTFAERIDQQLDTTNSILNNLIQEWRVMTQIYQAAPLSEVPPIPFPDQDIQLVCIDEFDQPTVSSTLWRYSLETDEWQEEIVDTSLMLMYTLADDESIILMQLRFDQEEQQSLLQVWNQGSEQILSQGNRYIISLGQMDPTGQYLYSYVQPLSELASFPQHILHDLTDCEESGCAEQNLPGVPIWSPSGASVIYMEAPFLSIAPTLPDGRVWLIDSIPLDAAFRLYRQERFGQSDELIEIGTGFAPFWLDDETYGFMQSTDALNQSLMIASTKDDLPQQLLETADLLAVLPENANLPQLAINYILPDPFHADSFFLFANDFNINGFNGYIFRVNRHSGAVEYRLSSGSMFRHMTGFSPDGRYLLTTRSVTEQGSSTVNDFITLHDIEANRTHDILFDAPDFFSAFVFDWSANGQWMIAVSDDGLLELMAPEYNYRLLIEHEMGVCPTVTWINR